MKHIPEINVFLWDAVVVGSGIGSATAAYELIKAGKKVLILEKGHQTSPPNELPLWNESIEDSTSGRKFRPFLGEGPGGSSKIYGMVMERLEESDFQNHGGRWPTSLEQWLPFYKKAEELFSIKSASTPEEFSPLLQHLKTRGLKPYPLNLASKALPDCNFCQSKLCEKSCKIDACSGPLEAIKNHPNLSILYGAKVTKVLVGKNRASGVEVEIGNEVITLQADSVFLGLGALRTPYLLKNSATQDYPNGLGNSRDLLGRYLMRHYVDLYFLKWKGSDIVKDHKSIGLNDFYKEAGMFQSFGSLPPTKYVLEEILGNAKWARLIPGVQRVLNFFIKRIFSTHVMASIVEDSPNYSNRLIFTTKDVLKFEYSISDVDKLRIEKSRKIAKMIFKPLLSRVQYEAENNKRLAHVCGTCKMGDSIENSVVDQCGKLHGFENLYVVDSSVFPASTGKNPSLTIAAHAMKCVAQYLLQDDGKQSLQKDIA